MSLRYAHVRHPTPPSVLNIPPSPSAPPASPQARHLSQLSSYRIDPAKARPVSFPDGPQTPTSSTTKRTATTTTTAGSPSSSFLSPSSSSSFLGIELPIPGRWSGLRRPSAVLEEGDHDDKLGKRRSIRNRIRSPIFTRLRKAILILCILLGVYLTLFRRRTSSSQPSSLKHKDQSQSSSTDPHSKNHYARDHPPGRTGKSKAEAAEENRSFDHDHLIQSGLLRVNASSSIHPIHQLIRTARAEWDAKVERQSKTLEEAVEEYRRRYRMEPPRGFSKWWDYVCEHNIPLPDEYDVIHESLAPFHALSPSDLNARITLASQQEDTFMLKIKHGSIRTSVLDSAKIHGSDQRLAGQVDLVREVARHLPDLRAVWWLHDTPGVVVGWDHRRELMDLVEEGEYWDPHEEVDQTVRGWQAACPYSSAINLRRRRKDARSTSSASSYNTFSPIEESVVGPNAPVSHKTFISSHSALMDICNNPSLIPIHGFLAGKNPNVMPLTPLFALSKTHLHADILGIPFEHWVNASAETHVPFEEKKSDKLLWRGSNTGGYYSASTPWRRTHRVRAVKLANALDEEEMRLLPGGEGMEGQPRTKGGKGKKHPSLEERSQVVDRGLVNVRWMDIAFTGFPLQCENADGTCDELREEYPWVKLMEFEEAEHYKYILDIDGNAWSARFQRLLSSGSLVFKSTIMPEWWTDRVQPWVHYVPVQVDYSDLYDVLAFFRGTPSSPNSGASALAAEIASSGREWAATHWRKEDMTAYMFRLYLEWGRLVSDKGRRKMDFSWDEVRA